MPNVEPALGTSGSSDACQSLDDSRLGTGEEAIEPAGERTEVMGRQPKDVSNRYQSSMPPSASSHPIRFGYDAQTAPAPAIPLGSEAGGAEDGDERISPRLRRNVSEVMESLAKVLEVQQEQKDLKNKAKILEQSREAREERASHLERAPTGQGDGSGGASASNPQPQGPANPLPKVTPGRGTPRAGARKSSLERSDSGSRREAAAGFWAIPVVQSCVRLHLPKEGLEIFSPFPCRRFRTGRWDHVTGQLFGGINARRCRVVPSVRVLLP